MAYFPTNCIDNFFELPDTIKDYALTADNFNWHPEPNGAWPGVRSINISEFNLDLYKEVAIRYLQIFFSKEQMKNLAFYADMYFQKIDKDYNGGWVHCDYPYIHTSIIYLTPGVSLDSGTSMYHLKSPVFNSSHELISKKNDLYLGKITKEEAEEYRIKNNNQYTKTISYSNVYNRCIGFDGNVHHSADTFPDKDKKERLTLLIFWHQLSGVTNLQYSKSIPQGMQFGAPQYISN
jgi:hypothetical protein